MADCACMRATTILLELTYEYIVDGGGICNRVIACRTTLSLSMLTGRDIFLERPPVIYEYTAAAASVLMQNTSRIDLL